MDKQEIRRTRLREWTAKHGVPQKEKSYFSQLFGGASIGEKAARRLEKDYDMGEFYLDGPVHPQLEAVPASSPANAELLDGDQLIELISLFQQANPSGRDFIMTSARRATKGVAARWERVVND
jgi:hypothetical protein